MTQTTKPKRIALTLRQHEIAGFIRRFVDRNGISPTYQGIADHFSISRPTVWEHIHAMVRRGALTLTPDLACSIVLADGVGMVTTQDERDAAKAEEIEEELAQDYG